MKRDRQNLPPRLAEGEGATAELLRKFESLAPHAPSEAAVWERTLARLARDVTRPRLRVGLAAASGALLGAAGIYLLLLPRLAPVAPVALPGASPSAVVAPVGVAGARDAIVPPPVDPPGGPATKADSRSVGGGVPRIELGHATVGLPLGEVDLLGEARVTLSRDGSARASADEQAATVELAAGRIELEVDRRTAAEGRRFEVVAGPYRFIVLGTRFRVERSVAAVTLSVSEGRVAVHRGATLLEVVAGGGRWSSRLADGGVSTSRARASVEPEPAGAPGRDSDGPVERSVERNVERSVSQPEPAPLAPGGTPSNGPSFGSTLQATPRQLLCADRAGSDPRTAVDCYLAQARGTGLAAEVALYEAARLRRDTLSDPAGALAALREHRRRFPSGTLATEVGLSIAELLPKLGRYREALDEVATLLGAHPRGERLGELQLLRGHVLREGLHDGAGAERAYAAALAADANGRAADPAAYWRAVCLEDLGRIEEARAAYRTYLGRPRALRAAEAARRLDVLEREHSGSRQAPTGQPPGGSP